MELKAIDYILIIITLIGVIFLAYRFMIYLGKIRSAPGYAKRKIIGFLFLAFISLTGIIPLFRGSIMDSLGLEVPQYFTEYSFGTFVVLAIAAVLVVRNDQRKVSTTKIEQTNKEGDNIAGDKIGNDKVEGDKIGGDKIEKKEVQGDEIKGDKIVHINPAPRVNGPKKLTFVQKINPDELVGRKNDLEKLHQLLTEKKKVVVVNGMGGIGKTTLAAAYTFQFEAYYQKIVWITQSQEDISNDFIQNQQLLNSLKIETEGKQADQLFAEILHALINIPEKPKLLVIDNAFESLEAHLDKLPSQPEWDLLVTSREVIEGLHTMPLDFLTEAEAITLFQKHCTRISDTEAIKELVNTVELHTLTIEILARTAQKQRTEPEALKKALETDLKAHIKTAHSKKNQIERVTSYLGTIFDFSTLSTDEIWLLKNFCALPAEFHSYKLLLNLIDPEKTGRQKLFAETLEQLVQKGWLLRDLSGESYRLHRVIAETILSKTSIAPEEITGLSDRLTQLLELDQTKDNPVDKFIWIPFGQACLRVLEAFETPETSQLQNHLASALQDLGEYQNAKILLQKAMISDEKNFGEEHPNTAVRYSNLALVLKDLGDYQGAKDLLQKALISDEKNFGEHHPNTAVRYSNLALVLQALGDYQGAKDLLQKALISDEKNFGEEHPATAVRYSNLALVLQDLGDYQGAKDLLQKALISTEKNFGEEHPTTAVRYSNLATVLQDLGDYQGAKDLLQKALISAEKNFGEHHPNTARTYSNLATVLQDLGDYQGAKDLLQKALISAEKNFGEEHPTTAVRYSNLALVLQDLGDYQDAKDLLQKALISAEKNFGEEHPNTAVGYSNLALVLKDLGDYQGAKDLLQKAALSDEKNLGKIHPTTAIRYSNLAIVLHDLEEFPEAIHLAEKSLQIFQQVLPQGHPHIDQMKGNLEGIKYAAREAGAGE
ncbi:MAG: hypothetical protein Roseis3KO_14930 [Roseivirga sp.]